ncbi:MAG TPA: GAF domain-containing SpoIIE family protein phosphatase, partial [Acidimicrobiia bacterium]
PAIQGPFSVYFIDQLGHLVYADGPLNEMAPPPNAGLVTEALGGVIEGMPGIRNDPDRVVSASSIDTAGWVVVVETPRQQIVGSARRILLAELAVLMLLVVIGSTGAYVAVQRLDRMQDRVLAYASDLEALEDLTERLAGAATVDDIASVVADMAPPVLEGTGVRLLEPGMLTNEWQELLALDGRHLAVARSRSLSPRAQAWLTSLIDLVAQAVERTKLRQDESDARQSAERLADLALTLASAATRNELVDLVLRSSRVIEDTRSIGIGLVHRPSGQVRMRYRPDPGTDGLVIEVIDPKDDHPIAEVLTSGEPSFFPTADQALPDDAGGRALLPLGRNPVLGVLSLEFERSTALTARERALLRAKSQLIADALVVAANYEREHSVAMTLQNSLRPGRLPHIPGWDFSGAYRAGEEGLVVGGDWYDLLQLEDRVLLTIGDVSGRGAAAASTMGILRAAIRAYALSNADPSDILKSVDALLAVESADQIATALVMLVDPATASIVYSSAGHLPPLIVEQSGGRFLNNPPDVLLGAAGDARRVSHRLMLPPHASLVLVTDGVIERRDQSIEKGMLRLAELAAQMFKEGLKAEALLEAMLADSTASGDDAVVLVMTREGAITAVDLYAIAG